MKFTCNVPALLPVRDFPWLHVEAGENEVVFTSYSGTGVFVSVRASAEVSQAGSQSFIAKDWKNMAKKSVTFEAPFGAVAGVCRATFGAASQVVTAMEEPLSLPSPSFPAPFFSMPLDFGPMDVISDDQTRPPLNGLHVLADGKTILFEATDGHRMHRVTAPFKGVETEMVIPQIAVLALSKVKAKGADFQCAVTSSLIQIRKGDTTVRFYPADFQFPPCDQIIPANLVRTTTLPVGALLDALKGYPKGSAYNHYDLTLTISAESLTVSREDVFSVTFATPTTGMMGETFKIDVNMHYLQDALKLFKETATMGTEGEEDPMLFQENERLAVVMPMRR